MQKENSLISILVPNYNKGIFLEEMLFSIINQTYPYWECIIVDDHSDDNSMEILTRFAALEPRIKVFKRPSEMKKGGNAARNYAFSKSKGSYVTWFDSDDVMHTNNLEERVKFLNEDPTLDFVLGNIFCFKDSPENAQEVKKLDLGQRNINFVLNMLKGNFWVQTSLPLFKREFLYKFNRFFDEELIWDQEAEFFSRVLLKNPKFVFSKDSITYYRTGIPSQTSSFRFSDLAERQLLSYKSFKIIFRNFRKERDLLQEETKFFKWYFGVQLVTMKIKFPEYFDLIKFGISEKTFPSYFFVIKILIYRMIREPYHFIRSRLLPV